MLRRIFCLFGYHLEWKKVMHEGLETIVVYDNCPRCTKFLGEWDYEIKWGAHHD